MMNMSHPHLSKPAVLIPCLLLMACTTATATPQPGDNQRQGNAARQEATATSVSARTELTTSVITVDGSLALGSPVLALGFDTTGKVRSVNASVGQRVRRGDVLATVDDTALKDGIVDAQAALDSAQASVAQQSIPATKEDLAAAEASLNSAFASYNTVKTGSTAVDIAASRKSLEGARLSLQSAQASRDLVCGRSGTESITCKQQELTLGSSFESWVSSQDALNKLLTPPSQDSLTQANASIVSARARLDALKGGISDTQRKVNETQLAQATAVLQRAKDKLATAQLIAPCDCTVQEVNIAVGSAAGSSAITLVNLAVLQFKTTNVSERDVARLKQGAPAQIRLRTYAEPLAGKVSAVLAQSSGTQGNTATYTVLIDLAAAQKLLLPGMTGQADVTVPSS